MKRYIYFAVLFSMLLAILACGGGSSNPVDKYVNEYGGKPEVYARIISITDCIELQKEFEKAYANNQRESAGTPAFKWTLGYMTATDEHMKEIGCYK